MEEQGLRDGLAAHHAFTLFEDCLNRLILAEYKGYNGSPPSRSALLMAPIKPIPPLSKA